MACQCQQRGETGMDLFSPQLMAGLGESEHLNFFIQGVRVGMQIRQIEQAKWTRIAVIASLTFGLLSWVKSNR